MMSTPSLKVSQLAEMVNQRSDVPIIEKPVMPGKVDQRRQFDIIPSFLYVENRGFRYAIEAAEWMVLGLRIGQVKAATRSKIGHIFRIAVMVWGNNQSTLDRLADHYAAAGQDYFVFLRRLINDG